MENYKMSKEELQRIESIPLPVGIYQYLNGEIITIALTDGFCELFGRENRDMGYYDMIDHLHKYDHPDDIARIDSMGAWFATGGEVYDIVFRTKDRLGPGYRIIHAKGRHIQTETGAHLAYVSYMDEGICADEEGENETALIRSLKHELHEGSLLKANRYDYLTGLPSMSWFFEQAEAWKESSQTGTNAGVILFIDLCGMKYFNHKYGFAQGDKYLQSFAMILSEIFGHEHCSRLAQDHFGVYTEEDGVEEKLSQLFQNCRKLNGGDPLQVRAGIYEYKKEDASVSSACDRAKIACDAIRGGFESSFNYYKQELRDDMVKKQYILGNLDRAIRERWIQVYYQPIVRAVTGRVCDEEALARWVDPVKGFLSPVDFIPYLEESGQIYKLDLYVLDRILEKIHDMERIGLYAVSQSLNLSRSDFDACDIVEEIRKRVDASGVSRDKINIEITESIIGNDLDFMKAQVERFQELGFHVWMDDFGSGYSSLEVLQSIQFDLIKFDMSFMKRLDEGENGKIILAEMMSMATALGVDTVCEGVETERQVRFLREIGCSKLQGYYFLKPVPAETIFENYKNGTLIRYENPEESVYYETIGRINLNDLTVFGSEEESEFLNYFNTIPMSIIEVKDGQIHFVRSNRSYLEFLRRIFGENLTVDGMNTSSDQYQTTSNFMSKIVACCRSGNRAFFDDVIPDGSVVHYYVRRVGTNPMTGSIAVAVAVLSITETSDEAIYSRIARALATDFYHLYYVDLETDRYIEYSSPAGGEELAVEQHGEGFFASREAVCRARLYEEDQDLFISNFTKENILHDIDEKGGFYTNLPADRWRSSCLCWDESCPDTVRRKSSNRRSQHY